MLRSLLTVGRFAPPNLNLVRSLIRPIVKVDLDYFELVLDVRNYNIDELKVKAHPDFVTIEGKQERKIPDGYVMRKFTKKYKLPAKCEIHNMKSFLSQEGMLTVQVNRNHCGRNEPCEINIPIQCACIKDKQDTMDHSATSNVPLSPGKTPPKDSCNPSSPKPK